MRKSFVIFATFAALAACAQSQDTRPTFDGHYFRGRIDRDSEDKARFDVKVSPVSQSLDGAREAGRYEATKFCLRQYSTSDIDWIAGPDADAASLRIEDDVLILRGACVDVQ